MSQNIEHLVPRCNNFIFNIDLVSVYDYGKNYVACLIDTSYGMTMISAITFDPIAIFTSKQGTPHQHGLWVASIWHFYIFNKEIMKMYGSLATQLYR